MSIGSRSDLLVSLEMRLPVTRCTRLVAVDRLVPIMDKQMTTAVAAGREDIDSGQLSGDSLSMHANVPVWCDCCSCEAEPYWVEAMGNQEADDG